MRDRGQGRAGRKRHDLSATLAEHVINHELDRDAAGASVIRTVRLEDRYLQRLFHTRQWRPGPGGWHLLTSSVPGFLLNLLFAQVRYVCFTKGPRDANMLKEVFKSWCLLLINQCSLQNKMLLLYKIKCCSLTPFDSIICWHANLGDGKIESVKVNIFI